MGILARILSSLSRPFRWLGALGASSVLALSAPSAEARAAQIAADSSAQAQAHAALSAFLEPGTRSTVTWSPAALRTAESTADSGDMRLVGELCEWIFADERVSTCIGTRCDALFGCELTFEKGRGLSARAALRSLEAEEDFWTLLPETEQKQALAWGLTLGVALVYEDHGDRPASLGARDVPTYRVWSGRHLRFDIQARKVYVRVQAASGGTREVEATPENGFHLFCPYGTGFPWKRGLWRGLGRFVLAKQYALSDFAGMSELHGKPAWVVSKKDASALSKHRKDLADEIAALGKGAVVVLPAGFDLQLVEAKARTWEMFTAQIKLSNDAIGIAYLGGNLLTDAGDGAATGATQQGLNLHGKKKNDAAAFSTWVHDTVLTRWAVANFGNAQVAPWPVWDIEPPADVEANARAIKGLGEAITALDAALAPHNLEADAKALCDEYGVPVKPLAAAAPAAPVAPPFGSGEQLAAVIPMAGWRGVGKRNRAGRAA